MFEEKRNKVCMSGVWCWVWVRGEVGTNKIAKALQCKSLNVSPFLVSVRFSVLNETTVGGFHKQPAQ